MVGAVGWDFESSVERAWQRFPSRLADRLAELAVGELLVLDASTAGENGGLPFVAFLGEGAGRFEAEVSSNAYLHARHAIDAHGDASLQERGWRSRTPFSLHRDRRTARTRGGGCCRALRCSRRQLPLAELPFVGTVDGPHPLERRYVLAGTTTPRWVRHGSRDGSGTAKGQRAVSSSRTSQGVR